jgi:hypothetical protein
MTELEYNQELQHHRNNLSAFNLQESMGNYHNREVKIWTESKLTDLVINKNVYITVL